MAAAALWLWLVVAAAALWLGVAAAAAAMGKKGQSAKRAPPKNEKKNYRCDDGAVSFFHYSGADWG